MIKAELMAKSIKNMNNTVVIPTAGLGNRMGALTKNLNKALLPYKEKPIISHIIENFPSDTNFIIALGYLADQVKDFLKITFPERDITFVEVDDYTSEKSGTAYTLKCCKKYINSAFWYVPCDTFFDENVVDKITDHNIYFVKSVPEDISHLYTMLEVDHGSIIDLLFKQKASDGHKAFTGLMYINDWQKFFADLENLNSNEFVYIIEKYGKTEKLNSWIDFGDQKSYQTALSKSQKFDFSKKDEITYICNNKTVKWWFKNNVSEQKFLRSSKNSKVFPENCNNIGNYIAYDFFAGKTLYQFNNPVAFNELLNWLDSNLWIVDKSKNINELCEKFYKNKSLERINMFLEKYPNIANVDQVDDVKVKNYQHYLDNIDWEYLSKTNLPGFIHGDLQFDNIIINNAGEFRLIDWRHEFAGSTEIGDIYYDLAKMAGGFIINYANIKNHNFDIEFDENNVILSIPNIDHISRYQEKLFQYINHKNLDSKKVLQLIPIIFWNMSPLHTAPFDQFLWFLGLKLFAQNEKVL